MSDHAGAMDSDARSAPWPEAEPVTAPPRQRVWAKVGIWLLSFAIALAVIFGFSHLRDAELLALFFLLVPAYWLHVVLHEAGHALAGMSCGMRPIAFGIGPFRFERGMSGWRWRHGGAIAGVGGFAMLLPSIEHAQRRRDVAWYLLGGTLATLGVTAVAIAMAYRLDSPSLTRSLWGALVAIGVPGIALNLVPLTVKGWRNDGRQLLDLLLGRPGALVSQKLSSAAALSMAGVRPRDWPAGLVPFEIPETGPLRANALLMQMGWADDSNDKPLLDRTAAELAEVFWSAPAAMRPHLALALAGHAIDAGAIDAARAWRPLCEGGLLHQGAARGWLDAALALEGGDVDKARVEIAFARLEMSKMFDVAGVQILGEHLDALEARIEQGRRQHAAIPT